MHMKEYKISRLPNNLIKVTSTSNLFTSVHCTVYYGKNERLPKIFAKIFGNANYMKNGYKCK